VGIVQIAEAKTKLDGELESLEASLAAAGSPSGMITPEGLQSQSAVSQLDLQIQELEVLHASAHRHSLLLLEGSTVYPPISGPLIKGGFF
jgi:hypothetical protein